MLIPVSSHSLSSFPLSQPFPTLVHLSHNCFPSPFQLLLLGKAGSGNWHRSLSCESRLETTLKSQSGKAKDTNAPLFSHFPFGQCSGQLSGFRGFSALAQVPRNSPRTRGKLHSCDLRSGAWLEMLLLRILWCCCSRTWPTGAHPHFQAFIFLCSPFGSH